MVELLSPAGNFEKLTMALTYGADAVYLAGKSYGMRAAAENFDLEELKSAVEFCHSQGKRLYVTCNTVVNNQELDKLPDFLQYIDSIGVDAVIVTDLGVLKMAGTYAPHTEKHISTQAGIMNYASANVMYDLGAKRVILARELTLNEISEIRANVPDDLELEVFIHGSMCVSYSGRCLLSNYMTGRDGNRGQCAQPCRWKYALVEEKRPNEYYEIFEDESGGAYILNSKDLCMIKHIPELIQAGINSFKIEGRMKSSYYTAVITGAYRHAIDAYLSGIAIDPVWIEEVNKVSHRNYYTGFFFDKQPDGQYPNSSDYIREWEISAVVLNCTSENRAELSQRNRIAVGDEVELLAPHHKPVVFRIDSLTDESGQAISAAAHPLMKFFMELPFQAPSNSIIRKKK